MTKTVRGPSQSYYIKSRRNHIGLKTDMEVEWKIKSLN
nr:MAG TPA: hypothetical protein [Caudoviricetes sp.]